MSAAPRSTVRGAILAGQYELAALRLLYGLLLTLEEGAPAAREALLDELSGERGTESGR